MVAAPIDIIQPRVSNELLARTLFIVARQLIVTVLVEEFVSRLTARDYVSDVAVPFDATGISFANGHAEFFFVVANQNSVVLAVALVN